MSKRILTIDDDPDIIEFLDIILRHEGYDVISSSSPSNIFNTIQLQRPDLILLDINLGSYNGLEICKAMRSYIRTGETPVLIISADNAIENAVKDFGATDIIQKPFDTNLLIEKISYYLSSKDV
ncbi:response regulator [Daejeonella sp.]|uniref:response regulator n=1 Tax=Daejeonella sp. TaxID=2805397 RepID=UPI003983087C